MSGKSVHRSKSMDNSFSFFGLNRGREGRRRTINIIEFRIFMTHAEAASLCTKIVEKYKGNNEMIDQECKKIRDTYFSQHERK